MSKYYGELFRLALWNLRVQCPVPVIIRTVDEEVLKRHHGDEESPFGDCLEIRRGKKKMFRIRIMRGLTENEAIECLVHEWAHAMDWSINGDATEIHRNSWGECYSKAHRAITNPKDQKCTKS